MIQLSQVLCLTALISSIGVTGATASNLAETSWRLVKIISMNDRIDEPGDRSLYTLAFKADGSVSMKADCNLGTGSWTSKSVGQLQFGTIAATRALCPPGSQSDNYLTQFQWVRSYVMKNNHLFLATMADGSILEFEPIDGPPLVATVLGEEIHTADAQEMQDAILTRLFDQYASEHGIKAEESEINRLVEQLQNTASANDLNATDDLTPEESAEIDTMRQDMARGIIRQWKLNRELYHQYGGRVIYQQFGPEPLDAYRKFLEQRQHAGAFTIYNPAFETEFWHYFTDESIHDFYPPESEAKAFKIPP